MKFYVQIYTRVKNSFFGTSRTRQGREDFRMKIKLPLINVTHMHHRAVASSSHGNIYLLIY